MTIRLRIISILLTRWARTLLPLRDLAAALLLTLTATTLVTLGVPTSAQAQGVLRQADHGRTGFDLTGVHIAQRCETCHLNGVFKGTPTQCASCHTAGMPLAIQNVVKPQSHIPTTATCDTCHNTASFANTRFNHVGINPSGCNTCHNGVSAEGKPIGHIPTTMNCGTCHNVSAWLPASGVDHTQFTTATVCTTCHNGSAADGKPASHMPTTLNCGSCHAPTSASFGVFTWDHTQMPVAGKCSVCHTGAYIGALGKTANHIPYQTITGVVIGDCDSCHKAGYVSFNPGQFHANVSVSGQCATCHLTGIYGLSSKPADVTHASVTGNCEFCHTSTAAWATTSKPDHSAFTSATVCTSCHNGTTATGKIATHMPTTLNCGTCHSAQAVDFSTTTWNHTQMPVAGTCTTCHTGAYYLALGKTSNHIPYASITGITVGDCDTCHKAGYASFNPGFFHRYFTLSSQCATCHLSAAYGVTSKPADATHSAITGKCESCHVSTSSWTTTTKPDHSSYTTATLCTTCHNGTTATGKIANHMPTTVNCGSCHSPMAVDFSTTTWNHTQMAVTGICSTCHTGAYLGALGKPATHIPYLTLTGVVIGDCDSCHKTGFTSFNPGYFHTNITISSQCAVCHLTTAYGLTSKPADTTHSTITGNCENCHSSTASWASTTRPNHSTFTSATICSTCHNGTTAMGKVSNHMPTTLECGNCHTPTAVDFSTTTWNHTQMPVAGVCGTCHTGSYLNAQGKSTNHILYATLVGATVGPNACDTCHKGGYTSFYPGKFHANVTVSGGCNSCHGTAAYGLTVQPTNHIPLAQLLGGSTLQCNACHTGTSVWTSYSMNHNNTTGNGAGWCIGCHQQGLSYLGNIQTKSLAHKKSGVPDCSYSGCHRPTGNTGTVYKSFGG